MESTNLQNISCFCDFWKKKNQTFLHSLILKLTKFSMQFKADPHHYKVHKIDNTCKYFTEMHKYE